MSRAGASAVMDGATPAAQRAPPLTPCARALLERYYSPGGAPRDDAGLSSHWQDFTTRTVVELTPDGSLATAHGYGFGDMNSRRAGTTLLARLAEHAHGRRHPVPARVRALGRTARALMARAGLTYNQDAVRQVLTAALLEARGAVPASGRALIIGDGYGVLATLLRTIAPGLQIVLIDIGRTLFFQAVTLSAACPDARCAVAGLDPGARPDEADVVLVPVDHLDAWAPRPVDLAVNIASMQEMAAADIARYFALLRACPATLFYCCNRERKAMPGGEVSAFAAYPWAPGDEHLLDGPCPWHQWYFRPRIGVRLPPFSLRAHYDGVHLHRLTRLAPAGTDARP